jgi:hypothetical protein
MVSVTSWPLLGPLLQVASLVAGSFRMGLSKGLVECAKQWGSFLACEGARLGPLVETMPSRWGRACWGAYS